MFSKMTKYQQVAGRTTLWEVSGFRPYLSRPSRLILDSSVCRGIPSFAAAPEGPEIRPWLSARAASMISTSRSASAERPDAAFQFRLPQSTPGIPAYQLSGASLVSYQGSPAALVIYEKQKERISLLVASSQSAVVAGGEEVRSGALMFHYRTDQGFKVVTWSNHGLSYALVSSVSGSARESCMVCHQSMADHQNFRSGR